MRKLTGCFAIPDPIIEIRRKIRLFRVEAKAAFMLAAKLIADASSIRFRSPHCSADPSVFARSWISSETDLNLPHAA